MTPNLYIYSSNLSKHKPTLPAGFHSAELTAHIHGGDVTIGRWRERAAYGRRFKSRTIRATDAAGRVVELIQYKDLP